MIGSYNLNILLAMASVFCNMEYSVERRYNLSKRGLLISGFHLHIYFVGKKELYCISLFSDFREQCRDNRTRTDPIQTGR